MNILREIFGVSVIKTIKVNFEALPFLQAVKFPIIVSRNVKIDGRLAKNSIIVNEKANTASILLGIGGSHNFSYFRTKKSYLKVSKCSRLVFDGTARIGQHFTINIKKGSIRFGNGFSSNNGCLFFCEEGIQFGENCMVGRDVEIRDSDGHTIIELGDKIKKEKENKKPVKIGNHVWICSHVTILKGVNIGNDCVVAHSSVCTKTIIGDNKLIGGYPAKVIKENISWKK